MSKYNQYYKHQNSNVNTEDHLAKKPEDEPKQDLDASADGIQQSQPDNNDNQQNPENTPDPIMGFVDNCLKLNIRKEPNLKADILCEVPVSTELLIDPSRSNEEWFSVITDSGISGFCMAKYVKIA